MWCNWCVSRWRSLLYRFFLEHLVKCRLPHFVRVYIGPNVGQENNIAMVVRPNWLHLFWLASWWHCNTRARHYYIEWYHMIITSKHKYLDADRMGGKVENSEWNANVTPPIALKLLHSALTERDFWDLTDVTLVDEDTNSTLPYNANRAIQGNMWP